MVVMSGNEFADPGMDVDIADLDIPAQNVDTSDLVDDFDQTVDTDWIDEATDDGGSVPGTEPSSLEAAYFGDDPADAAQVWHLQESSHSCAVAAQEFVLNDITGGNHSEAELCAIAEENGWYTPGQGTAPEDIGKVLNTFGIPTEHHDGATVEDLATALANGEEVIVGVDSGEIVSPGFDPSEPLDHYPGVPGQGADHAIQIIGIDNRDPANPMVVVNDPGLPDGQGGALSLSVFAEAWEDSGNMMVTAKAPV
jgi:hypothetical protein